MTGNKIVDQLIIALCTLASMAALGVFVYTTMLYEKPRLNDDLEKSSMMAETKKLVFPAPFKLKKMTINLKSKRRGRLRFIDVEIHLVPFKDGESDKIENKKPMIRDSIIDIIGHMNPSELNSVSGKLILESRIKKRTNEIIGKKIIKGVLFSHFVVQ
jgi:flagellar FliL protein